ncbi:MAG: hypothetical protein IKN55_08935 [Oscillospiraceae bacterium]|nr:hypothetical protein [Oscillospiraceae bacterium]
MRSGLFALAAACILAAGVLVGCGSTKESQSDVVTNAGESNGESKSDTVTDADESTEESESDGVTNDDESAEKSQSDIVTDGDESAEESSSDIVTDGDKSAEESKSDNDTDDGGNKTESGAKQALKDSIVLQTIKGSAEAYYLVKWPRTIIEMYKEADPDYYEVRKRLFDDNAEEGCKTFRVKEITNIEEVDKDILCVAEYYFLAGAKNVWGLDSDDIDVEVSKGYKMNFELEYDNGEGLEIDDKCFEYVVWVDGDGWKAIDGSTILIYANEYKSKNGTQ